MTHVSQQARKRKRTLIVTLSSFLKPPGVALSRHTAKRWTGQPKHRTCTTSRRSGPLWACACGGRFGSLTGLLFTLTSLFASTARQVIAKRPRRDAPYRSQKTSTSRFSKEAAAGKD